jgi:hypothetical protein
MSVADPDGVQVFQPQVVLQRAEDPATDVNENVRRAGL